MALRRGRACCRRARSSWPARRGCEQQAFRLGRLAWGIQFHIETDAGDRAGLGRRGRTTSSPTTTSTRSSSAPPRSHDDLAEVWQPFAAAFADIVRDPGAVPAPRGCRRRRAAPVTDPAAIRAALAAEANASRAACCRCRACAGPTMTEQATADPRIRRSAPRLARLSFADGERAAELLSAPPLALVGRRPVAPSRRRRRGGDRRARSHRRSRRGAARRWPSSRPPTAARAARRAAPPAPSCAPGCCRCSAVSPALAEHLSADPGDLARAGRAGRPHRHGGPAGRGGRRRRDVPGRRAPAARARRSPAPARRARCARRTGASWSRSPAATCPASSACAAVTQRARRPGRLHPAGRARRRRGRAARRRRAVPAGDHRDGQDRRPRAELRLRRRRRLRRRAGEYDGAEADAERGAAHRDHAWPASTMRLCREVAWEVDAALRPEGKDGPLVRTLASHEAYYQRWASTWEFQALLKARPVAGDLELGARYEAAIAPLVWTAAERPNFVARRAGDAPPGRSRTSPPTSPTASSSSAPAGCATSSSPCSCCSSCTAAATSRCAPARRCRALDALRDGGYVGRDDALSLADAYAFLRATEHRLQLRRLRRTHLVPDDAEQLTLAGPGDGLPARRARRRPRGVAGGVGAARPRGAPAAREAVLPPAARRRRAGAVGGAAADPGGGRAPAGRARASPIPPGRCSTSRR